MSKQKLSFKHAMTRAAKILRDKDLSLNLAEKARKSLSSRAKVSKKIKSVQKVFSDYIRLFRYYISGKYRDISWKSILYITAILIYFVTPTDLIPDFLPVTGLIDDATLAVWLYQHISEEMNKFLEWEQTQKDLKSLEEYD